MSRNLTMPILVLAAVLSWAGCTSPGSMLQLGDEAHLPVYSQAPGQPGDFIEAVCLGQGFPGKTALEVLENPTLGFWLPRTVMDQVRIQISDHYRARPFANLEVRFYRLRYWTQDHSHRPIAVSALLLLPLSPDGSLRAWPLLEINHATQLGKDVGPSRLDYAEDVASWMAAASGVAVILPDYPGYGDSAPFHPYCQAAGLGHACRDALAASQAFCATLASGEGHLDGRLTLAGYSEGGYATLACLAELERRPVPGLKLEAVFPMAAPVDISGNLQQQVLHSPDFPHPWFLVYLLLGWRTLDPELLEPSRIFHPLIASRVVPLFDGRQGSRQIDKVIRSIIKNQPMVAMLSDEAADWITRPQASPEGRAFLGILQANDLLEVPAAPGLRVTLIHSPKDQVVPFSTAQKLLAWFSTQTSATRLVALQPLDHATSFFEAWLTAFAEIREFWMLDSATVRV